MAETSGGVIDSVVQLLSQFGEIALGVDPMTSALLISGAVITGLSVAVFGYLAAGAALEFLVSLVPGGRQPPQRE